MNARPRRAGGNPRTGPALACIVLAALPTDPRPQTADPQADFAREALEALAAHDRPLLAALVGEFPFRARLLAHELVWESLRARPPGGAPLEAARSLLGALRAESAALAACERSPNEELAAALGTAEALEPPADEEQRRLDRAFFAATSAFGRGELESARDDAGDAAARAAALGLAYLEMRSRRLLAEALRAGADPTEARAELEETIALDQRLGLWPLASADLEALASWEREDGRWSRAGDTLARAEELARRSADPARACALSVSRAEVLTALGDGAGARRLLLEAQRTARAEGQEAAATRAVLQLGELAAGEGRYEDALRAFGEAGRTLEAAGDARGALRASLRLAGVDSELGLVAEAEDALRRAARLLAREGLVEEQRAWCLTRGLVLLDAGRAAEAIEALAGVEELGAEDALYSEAQRQRGAAELLLGHPEEAVRAFRNALAHWSRDPLKNAWARSGLGDALLLQGATDAAEESYRAALADARGSASLEAAWRAHLGLARCAELGGRLELALEESERAIEALETLRGLLAAPTLRMRWLGNKLEPYRRAARLHARRGELDAAFRLFQSAQARTLLELRSAARAEGAPEERAHAARRADAAADAMRALELAEARLRTLSAALADLPRTATTPPDQEVRLEEARAAHEAARLALQLADPRAATLLGLADAPALEELRAALRPDERLVQYLVGVEGALVLVAAPGGARALELATDEARLAALVERVLAPIEELRAGRLDLATLGFDARAAEELYALLIRPLRAELEGAHTLWIVPDGPLRRLPFAVLVSRREKRPVDPERLFAQYEGCRFLVEDVAPALLPAAGLLLAPREDGGSGAGAVAGSAGEGSCLIVADPRPVPGGAAELAGSREEARVLAAGLAGADVRLLVGDAAEEGAVQAALAHARSAHLATHGLLDDRRPAFSRLALAPGPDHDGWLHAWEIERMQLSLERVVLSACETLGQAGRGEGLLGLARAFLSAGARSVVASAWAVDDRATSDLMGRYWHALLSGVEPIAALRQAQVELLRGPGRPGLSHVHPYFWGAFQHVGTR